jgi:hypothetical protein
LNAVTARLIPGTQAQKVILVALELQDLPPASTEALGLALLLAVPLAAAVPLLVPLLPQAATSATAARPVRPAVTRTRTLDLDNMMAKLPYRGVSGMLLLVRRLGVPAQAAHGLFSCSAAAAA